MIPSWIVVNSRSLIKPKILLHLAPAGNTLRIKGHDVVYLVPVCFFLGDGTTAIGGTMFLTNGDNKPTSSALRRIKPVTAAEAEMCKWSASFFNTSEVPRVIERLTLMYSSGVSSLFCAGFFEFINESLRQGKKNARGFLV